jgi:hypothetical protein
MVSERCWTPSQPRATIENNRDDMGWLAYAAAWLVLTLFWTIVAATAAQRSPLETFSIALPAMATAAAMGVGVWRLTHRAAWNPRAARFFAIHAVAMALFSVGYACSWLWPDLVLGRFAEARQYLRSSPLFSWNLLMGSWLYLVVAGLSYAVRANQRIRAEEAAAAEARLLAQQARLSALRARVNPHFLFNALHSVGALVSIDPIRADRALERLGDLLRYTLGTEDEVRFAQEWSFTHDYLAFEQLRLGDRLRVQASVDPAALATWVPPLILQPLVENAVRHGIADRTEGGRIDLSASVEGARLVIRVRDDGEGDQGESGEGLGLASVRERLIAVYGGNASLAIDGNAPGFGVTIALPIRARDLGSAA